MEIKIIFLIKMIKLKDVVIIKMKILMDLNGKLVMMELQMEYGYIINHLLFQIQRNLKKILQC